MAKVIVLPKADFEQLLLDTEGESLVIFTTQELLDEASLSVANVRQAVIDYDPTEADLWVELVGDEDHPVLAYVREAVPLASGEPEPALPETEQEELEEPAGGSDAPVAPDLEAPEVEQPEEPGPEEPVQPEPEHPATPAPEPTPEEA